VGRCFARLPAVRQQLFFNMKNEGMKKIKDEVLVCKQPLKKMKSCKQLGRSITNDYLTIVAANCNITTLPLRTCTTLMS
jgi:hypothetical protein